MKNLLQFFKRLEWINVAFLGLTPLVAVAGVVFLVSVHDLHWQTVIFALAYMAATGLAVTAGYHRLFAHKSYEASGLTKFILLLLGAAAFENSARLWASDHRNHHKYVDTDLDPYSIKKGFWFAHVGWILFKRTNADDHSNVADLDKDRLVRWQHRFYFPLAILMGFGLPLWVGGLWGDALGGLILAGFVRVVLNHHFTFLINSLCHYLGRQPYSDRNSSRDSWIPALLTYGEGYHNYHHTFPSDYRNGIRLYQWDPTKWLIRGLEWIKQTRRLRRMDEGRILEVKLRMEERRLSLRLSKLDHAAVTTMRQKLEEAFSRLKTLKVEYVQFKQQKIDSMNDRYQTIKSDLGKAKAEWKEALASWRYLLAETSAG